MVDNKAKLKKGNELYFRDWVELESTRRYIGMDGFPSRISILDVIAYANAFNYSEYERNFLVELVQKVDNAVIKKYGEDRSSRTGKKHGPHRRQPRRR